MTTEKASIAFWATILFAVQLSSFSKEEQTIQLWAQEKTDGIRWLYNLDQGLEKAETEQKPIMIHFTAAWCGPCQEMKKKAFSDARIIKISAKLIPVRIDIDEQRSVAEKYNALARKYGGVGVPNILFLSSNGKKLKHIVGYQSPEELLAAMNEALAPRK